MAASPVAPPVAEDPADRPPLWEVGPIGWVYRNLFNTWPNGLLTVAVMALLVWKIPPLINWLFIDSVISDVSPAVCRAAEGACWTFIRNWFDFIIFGFYPGDQHWRPFLAMILLLLLVVTTAAALRGNRNRILPALVTVLEGGLLLTAAWTAAAMLMAGEASVWSLLPWLCAALGLGLVVLGQFVRMLSEPKRRGAWLIAAWTVTPPIVFILMRGGLFGLEAVDTDRWGGLPLTIGLAVIGLGLGFPLGVLLALGRRSNLPAVRLLSIVYIELIRGVPFITVLFMAAFLFPLMMPPGVTIDSLIRAQAGIVVFASAYIAEVVRGGLQAIPKGQYEAADSLGLGYWKKTGLIILPQALRVSIPPLVNTFIAFIKDTSLVSLVGLTELVRTAKTALASPEWSVFYREAYLFVALVFFTLCFSLSRYSQALEKLLHRGVRR